MAASQILVSDSTTRRAPARLPALPTVGWTYLGWVGVVFACVGFLDIALAWYPSGLGNAAWEFGTVSASLNGLPLPALGITLLLAAGLAEGSRVKTRIALGMLVVLAVLLLAAAFLYVTVVPIALRDVGTGAVRTGLLKSIVKALALLLLYPTMFIWLAFAGWRAGRLR